MATGFYFDGFIDTPEGREEEKQMASSYHDGYKRVSDDGFGFPILVVAAMLFMIFFCWASSQAPKDKAKHPNHIIIEQQQRVIIER